jgi:hypothetical protein
MNRSCDLSLANYIAVIFHPRVQDELSQFFDFLIFKRGNSIQTELFKANEFSLTR